MEHLEGRVLLAVDLAPNPLATSINTIPIPSGFADVINGLATGSDGNLWFTATKNNQGSIGRVTPSGEVTDFPLPGPNETAGAIASGPDGDLWAVEGSGKIVRITTGGVITEFGLSSYSQPADITAGPDGNLWFTEQNSNKIGRISPDGSVTEFNIPTTVPRPPRFAVGLIGLTHPVSLPDPNDPTNPPTSGPEGIAAGADGNLWFTESLAGKIGRITPSGSITEYALPGPGEAPASILSGPDGNLWFTVSGRGGTGKIDRITPAGVITEFSLPDGYDAQGITIGPDGALWFTAKGLNPMDLVGRLNASGQFDDFVVDFVVPYFPFIPFDWSAPPPPTAPADHVGQVVTGADGNLWLTDAPGTDILQLVLSPSVNPPKVVTGSPGPLNDTVVTPTDPTTNVVTSTSTATIGPNSSVQTLAGAAVGEGAIKTAETTGDVVPAGAQDSATEGQVVAPASRSKARIPQRHHVPGLFQSRSGQFHGALAPIEGLFGRLTVRDLQRYVSKR